MKKFLRSPRLIVFEVTAIALAGALGALIPQEGASDGAQMSGLVGLDGVGKEIVTALGLNSLFTSVGFIALISLAGISLLVVVFDQFRGLPRRWRRVLTPQSFVGAPFRVEFDRAPRGEEGTRIRTTGRVGLLGSPLFHGGLVLIVVAGLARSLYGVDAVVDLIEGETLPPGAGGWSRQWSAPLASPLGLEEPLTLDSVDVGFYESGALEYLTVGVTIGNAENSRGAVIAVNEDLFAPRARLFLSSKFGPTALLEWQSAEAEVLKTAQMLAPDNSLTEYVGSMEGPAGQVAHLRAHLGQDDGRASGVSVHLMKNGALLKRALIQPGQSLEISPGERLLLHGLPMWVRLNGSVDRALLIAYAGFGLSILGALLMFTVIKVDTCVAVIARGDVERVTVSLRAHRFAPLFAERFERVVEKEGGRP